MRVVDGNVTARAEERSSGQLGNRAGWGDWADPPAFTTNCFSRACPQRRKGLSLAHLLRTIIGIMIFTLLGSLAYDIGVQRSEPNHIQTAPCEEMVSCSVLGIDFQF